MEISNFREPFSQAEQRYRAHSAQRRERRKNLQTLGHGGDWRKVDDPERIARRLQRLGLPADIENTAEPILLERILGGNDLITSDFLIRGATASRSVGRIVIRNAQGTVQGYGTGFLVSAVLLMTNNHVLESLDAARNSLVQFNYHETLTGLLTTPLTFRLQPENFFRTDPYLDFTLVAVEPVNQEGSELKRLGWNRLIAETGKVLVGERVNIIQHPGGGRQQLALRMNEVTDLLDDFLHYSADTERGSSGSPVFNDQWELVSLHHAGVPQRDENERILLVSGDPWDGSQDTFGQIAWKANEGARISRIVAYLNEQQADFSPEQRRLYEQAFSQAPEDLLEITPAPVPVNTSAPSGLRFASPSSILRSIPFEIRIAENGEVGLFFPAAIMGLNSGDEAPNHAGAAPTEVLGSMAAAQHKQHLSSGSNANYYQPAVRPRSNVAVLPEVY